MNSANSFQLGHPKHCPSHVQSYFLPRALFIMCSPAFSYLYAVVQCSSDIQNVQKLFIIVLGNDFTPSNGDLFKKATKNWPEHQIFLIATCNTHYKEYEFQRKHGWQMNYLLGKNVNVLLALTLTSAIWLHFKRECRNQLDIRLLIYRKKY